MKTGEILFRLGGLIVGLCIVGTGVAGMVSSESLMSMCRRGCALNAVLSLLGDEKGKLVYGGSIAALGLWVAVTSLLPGKRARESSSAASGDRAE